MLPRQQLIDLRARQQFLKKQLQTLDAIIAQIPKQLMKAV